LAFFPSCPQYWWATPTECSSERGRLAAPQAVEAERRLKSRYPHLEAVARTRTRWLSRWEALCSDLAAAKPVQPAKAALTSETARDIPPRSSK
jgi:hypothetical protein